MDKSQTEVNEITSRPATYQDVLDAPPHLIAEVIDGVLYTHSRPLLSYAQVGSEIGMTIGPPFHRGIGGPGGWLILKKPELHLCENIVVPDLTGWRRDRMPETPLAAFSFVVPDWVCEVLSPSTRSFDIGIKQKVYARVGVGHMWLVDPDACSLEAFKLTGADWELIDSLSGDVPVSLPPFEAISFDLGDFWGRLAIPS